MTPTTLENIYPNRMTRNGCLYRPLRWPGPRCDEITHRNMPRNAHHNTFDVTCDETTHRCMPRSNHSWALPASPITMAWLEIRRNQPWLHAAKHPPRCIRYKIRRNHPSFDATKHPPRPIRYKIRRSHPSLHATKHSPRPTQYRLRSHPSLHAT